MNSVYFRFCEVVEELEHIVLHCSKLGVFQITVSSIESFFNLNNITPSIRMKNHHSILTSIRNNYLFCASNCANYPEQITDKHKKEIEKFYNDIKEYRTKLDNNPSQNNDENLKKENKDTNLELQNAVNHIRIFHDV